MVSRAVWLPEAKRWEVDCSLLFDREVIATLGVGASPERATLDAGAQLMAAIARHPDLPLAFALRLCQATHTALLRVAEEGLLGAWDIQVGLWLDSEPVSYQISSTTA